MKSIYTRILLHIAVFAASVFLFSTLSMATKARRREVGARHHRSTSSSGHKRNNKKSSKKSKKKHRHHDQKPHGHGRNTPKNGSSPCFDVETTVGPRIETQGSLGEYGSVSVVNGGTGELWIEWLASERDDAPFASSWTAVLSGADRPNVWWMNDVSLFESCRLRIRV